MPVCCSTRLASVCSAVGKAAEVAPSRATRVTVRLMEQYTPVAAAAGVITSSAGAAPAAKPHD